MLGDYKKWFWTEFDKNFRLNYPIVLAGLTGELLPSAHKVNEFFIDEREAGKFYLKIAGLLLEQEGLENDLSMPIDKKASHFNIHSVHLANYLSSHPSKTQYNSFDAVYLAKYNSKSFNLNEDFSYLIGNIVRFYDKGTLRLSDTKRLYILSSIIDRFSTRADYVRLTVSRAVDGSYLKFHNEALMGRLDLQIKSLVGE